MRCLREKLICYSSVAHCVAAADVVRHILITSCFNSQRLWEVKMKNVLRLCPSIAIGTLWMVMLYMPSECVAQDKVARIELFIELLL